MKKLLLFSTFLAFVFLALPLKGGKKMEIKSPAFSNGGNIPMKYTCDGEDISPLLEWSNVPAGAKSIVLIMDDPDAPMGTWVHWVIYNIPATVKSLPERFPTKDIMKDGTTQGRNSWGRIGYGGPCPPPPTGAHRYFFKLYAIDKKLDLGPGATKEAVLQAIKGHILSEAEVMGKYKRR